MRLIRVRDCDGVCCTEAPRFPRLDGRPGCEYGYKGRCQLMINPERMPQGECKAVPGKTASEAHEETCVKWPENLPGESTGGCCLQWVAD